MKNKPLGKVTLAEMTLSHPIAYDLIGSKVVAKLFGIIPISRIQLNDVDFLRLASRNEVSAAFMMMNVFSFLPSRRSFQPVYILQSRSRRRLRMFLIMNGEKHFQLRNAISRNARRYDRSQMAA